MKLLNNSIKKGFTDFFKSFLCTTGNKYQKCLYFASILLIYISAFATISLQAPVFVSRNLNSMAIVIWVVTLIPLILLNYKKFFKSLLLVFTIAIPFLVYLLISGVAGVPSYSNGFTRTVFVSLVLFLIGCCAGYVINKDIHLKYIIIIYVVSTLLLAIYIYLSSLFGYDLSKQIYAYSSKNSAGPILFIAVILFHFYTLKYKTKSWFNIVLDVGVLLFFSTIIFLLKCRAVIFFIFIYVFVFYFDYVKSIFYRLMFCFLAIAAVALIVSVPYLNNLIIIKILLNNKTTDVISALSSGRIEEIIYQFSKFQPFLGSGTTYVDCMPILIVCCYGIIGTLMFLPILISPFFLLKKNTSLNTYESYLLKNLVVFFIFNSLFEGYGFYGPGAKIFIFWLLLGISYSSNCFDSVLFKKVYHDRIVERITSKKVFISTMLGILSVVSFSFMLLPPQYNSLSKQVVDFLPADKTPATYIEPKTIDINSVSEMFVGQEVLFTSSVAPAEATDKEVSWLSYNSSILEIDPLTGNAKAKRTGSVTISATLLRKKIYKEIVVRIVDYEQYSLNNLLISTDPTSFSLDEHIDMDINETRALFYNEKYCGYNANITFSSSDNNVCEIINNSYLRTKNNGSCFITASIVGPHNTVYSTNQIHLSVSDTVLIPPESINLVIPDTLYEKDIISLTVIFGSSKVDQGIKVEHSNNLSYFPLSKEIKCNGGGEAFLKIASLSNNDIIKTYNFHIKSIKPLKFINHDYWWTIGTIKKIDVYIEYDNGKIYPVELEDLRFDARQTEGRAYFNKNGIVDNYLTRAAISYGSIPVELVSKKDPSISLNYRIICRNYSYNDYLLKIRIVSSFLFNFMSVICYVLFLELTAKRKLYLSAIFVGAVVIINIVISLILKALYPVLFSSIPLIIVSLIWLLLYVIKKDSFNLFQCEFSSAKKPQTIDIYLEISI